MSTLLVIHPSTKRKIERGCYSLCRRPWEAYVQAWGTRAEGGLLLSMEQGVEWRTPASVPWEGEAMGGHHGCMGEQGRGHRLIGERPRHGCCCCREEPERRGKVAWGSSGGWRLLGASGGSGKCHQLQGRRLLFIGKS